MVRNSLNDASWKIRAEVVADLKSIYTCATADEAEQRLGEFEAKLDAPICRSDSPGTETSRASFRSSTTSRRSEK